MAFRVPERAGKRAQALPFAGFSQVLSRREEMTRDRRANLLRRAGQSA
jgi:hypothetical protein